jgi:hypothetical protein
VTGGLAFLSPWLLLGLIALPVIWWLLRAVPPAPERMPFPAVRLLLGLKDPERMPERTPWWLLLLRVVALGLIILAFAQPVLNPRPVTGEGPLLVLVDGGWADAPDWSQRTGRLSEALAEAGRAGRPVALVLGAGELPRDGLPLRAAGEWSERLAGLEPRPWPVDRAAVAEWVEGLGEVGFETLWLTDGVSDGSEGVLAEALLRRGPVTLVAPSRPALALTPPRLEEGALMVGVLRAGGDGPMPVTATAIGPDPQGIERVLGRTEAEFADGETRIDLALDLPIELRNRVSRVTLAQARSAGGTALADDAVRRRKVALMSGRPGGEEQELVDPLHYLRRALEPNAEIVEAGLADMLNTAPDVLVMADVGSLSADDRAMVTDWVERGGLLVRFAGPRLAASGAGQVEEDPLLPVRLRAGGRTLGGTMSWGAPRQLQPFPEGSPFEGLPLPADVEVTRQVMAQPDPDLPERVMASLEDGTPLVTGRPLGEGRVVLVHVTANADWSNLALSGLFVQMMERLTLSAGGLGRSEEELGAETWTPAQVLDGFGELGPASALAGVPGTRLAEGRPGPDAPPGIYASGDRRVALNVMDEAARLAPLAPLPSAVAVEAMERPGETRLGPWLLAAAIGLLAADILATLGLSGRMRRRAAGRAAAGLAAGLVAVALAASAATAPAAMAETPAHDDAEARALYAANETVLAYVITGDERVDSISRAGLRGLSRTLYNRTAIEPADPVGVDLERDDLALYPFLYWPVTETQPMPSNEAYQRLNDFLRFGGMILFDTRDAQLGGDARSSTPNGRVLQRIASRLDIPPLEPVPPDHVLTRTFYLLQDFPGRWQESAVWVEASPDAEEVEGMPFRNLNDGVTPVVIGANDWAAAWAVDESGQAMFPVGRGIAGERQREMAHRFGVNLIMYVMTGNYKSDQVHVPALLERLGQ